MPPTTSKTLTRSVLPLVLVCVAGAKVWAADSALPGQRDDETPRWRFALAALAAPIMLVEWEDEVAQPNPGLGLTTFADYELAPHFFVGVEHESILEARQSARRDVPYAGNLVARAGLQTSPGRSTQGYVAVGLGYGVILGAPIPWDDRTATARGLVTKLSVGATHNLTKRLFAVIQVAVERGFQKEYVEYSNYSYGTEQPWRLTCLNVALGVGFHR